MNPNKISPIPASTTELVPTGTLILAPKRGSLMCSTVKQQLTCQQVESAIKEQLSAIEFHRKSSAIADLRAGVLFHVYKQLKGKTGETFWRDCESEFSVGRATISRKMRLAVIWAKASGASEDQIFQLTNAADLTDKSSSPAVQLAFDFIGDLTITELYRKHKLIDPAPKGGNITPTDPETGKRMAAPRRTKAELERDAFNLSFKLWWKDSQSVLNKALTEECEGDKLWDLLEDDKLEWLRGSLTEVATKIAATQYRRAALRRLNNKN